VVWRSRILTLRAKLFAAFEKLLDILRALPTS